MASVIQGGPMKNRTGLCIVLLGTVLYAGNALEILVQQTIKENDVVFYRVTYQTTGGKVFTELLNQQQFGQLKADCAKNKARKTRKDKGKKERRDIQEELDEAQDDLAELQRKFIVSDEDRKQKKQAREEIRKLKKKLKRK